MLVEAKAHTRELRSDCQANEDGGWPAIRLALGNVKRDLGVPEERDWLNRYYQFANRLAVLHLLLSNNANARLLFVYFIGDERPDGIPCPQNKGEWEPALLEQANWLGLSDEHKLANRIYKLFVPTVMVGDKVPVLPERKETDRLRAGGGDRPKADAFGPMPVAPVGEGSAQCWMYLVKSDRIKVGQHQRTQTTSDTDGCVELVSETIQDGQAMFIVRCKKDESGKCANCHSVVALLVTDKEGNRIVETKVEITCRHR